MLLERHSSLQFVCVCALYKPSSCLMSILLQAIAQDVKVNSYMCYMSYFLKIHNLLSIHSNLFVRLYWKASAGASYFLILFLLV